MVVYDPAHAVDEATFEIFRSNIVIYSKEAPKSDIFEMRPSATEQWT